MRRTCPLLLAALLTASCATGPEVASYVGRGAVQGRAYGATFDSRNVIGPVVQLEWQRDGAWLGRVGRTPMSLRVLEKRVVGPNASADWEDGGKAWHLRVSLHNRSVTYVFGKLQPPQDGPDGTVVIARTRVGASGDYLELRVDRGADPTRLPWPQVGLALLPLPPPY